MKLTVLCPHFEPDVAPTGEVLVEAGEDEETLTATLDPEVVARARRTNPSLENRRM